jgi:hypothetical protein
VRSDAWAHPWLGGVGGLLIAGARRSAGSRRRLRLVHDFLAGGFILVLPGPWRTLHAKMVPELLSGLNLRRKQRRGCRLMKVGLHRLTQEVKCRATLLAAGRDDRPNAFAPTLSRVAARPLRQAAVDGHEATRLFRQVIGWFDIGCGDEAEVAVHVRDEAVGQVSRPGRLAVVPPGPPSPPRLAAARNAPVGTSGTSTPGRDAPRCAAG